MVTGYVIEFKSFEPDLNDNELELNPNYELELNPNYTNKP